MKKLTLLFLSVFFVSFLSAQDVSDALRYSQSEIQGTARFRALSGAFGALGGDMSAISANPAGSAVFSQSQTTFTASNLDSENASIYFNSLSTTNASNFDINQGGAVFVFKSNSNSAWRKFTLGLTYERTHNFDDTWFAIGRNNNQSIDLYFLENASGKRLDEISALPSESLSDAYLDIGSFYGFEHQQAFLGFESFILEPDDIDNDANTTYFSNLGDGSFNHDYSYFSRGFNGKITVNLAAQYEDNLYLGLNLNSHFIDFERSTLLFEDNTNEGSFINFIEFENNLSTIGTGFSFQLGGILKLSQEFRVGVTYDSPTWYTIEEETSQYLATDGDTFGFIEINPQVVNVYPRYRLQTPAKITGSAAYVFNKVGLISFDYSIKDYSKTQFRPEDDAYFANQNINIANTLTSAATYRVGGEYKVKQFSFRGGYRFEESPYANGVTVGDLTGYSLGLGYNFGNNTRLDLAYDRWNRTNQTSLFNTGLTDTAIIDNTNSNFTLSINFNI